MATWRDASSYARGAERIPDVWELRCGDEVVIVDDGVACRLHADAMLAEEEAEHEELSAADEINADSYCGRGNNL